MKKVVIVFGTRPEAIKMAPVVREFKQSALWETCVVVTGQHREMLDQVLELFDIVPDYDLNIMSPKQSLTSVTTKVLEGIGDVLTRVKPSLVLVHGDTTTAFASALAAFYRQIPIAHVEAGLRTGNLANPFPEEANRKLTDVLTALHFAPTERAAHNLKQEGVSMERVFVTGNTVIDALLSVVEPDYTFTIPELAHISWEKPVIVATVHRRESWGKPLEEICQAFREIAETLPVTIVFAMHKNPDIQRIVKGHLGNLTQVILIDAPGYAEFANLLNRCRLVMTDSGGLQEEAPALGKPVLVLRGQTERPEGIDAGTLKLVGTGKKDIVESVTKLVTDEQLYERMAKSVNPYGDGQASYRIRKIVEDNI